MGCKWGAFGDCTGIDLTCLQGKAKAGMDLLDLGKKSMRQQRSKWIKRAIFACKYFGGWLTCLVVCCPDQLSLSYTLIKPFPALFWVSGSAHSACVHRCLSAATSDCQAPERLGWVTESVSLSWAMGTPVCRAAHGAGVGVHSLCKYTGRMRSAWLLAGTGAWTCDSLTTHTLPELAQHFHLAQEKKRLLKISTQHVSETKFSFPVPHTVIIIISHTYINLLL